MKHASILLAGILAFGTAGTVSAQTPSAAAKNLYATFTSGVTVGHKTAALVGGELGWRADSTWDFFVEGGRMFDTTSAALDTAARTIAQFLGPSASFTAKQPTNYIDVGVRYRAPTSERFQPYVSAGVGAATVSRDVSFFVNGSDVTSQLLDKYGVQLGMDLAGKETKALVTVGFGAEFRLGGALFGDLGYHYGRIFLPERDLNTNRVQAGIGVRF